MGRIAALMASAGSVQKCATERRGLSAAVCRLGRIFGQLRRPSFNQRSHGMVGLIAGWRWRRLIQRKRSAPNTTSRDSSAAVCYLRSVPKGLHL